MTTVTKITDKMLQDALERVKEKEYKSCTYYHTTAKLGHATVKRI